ncbi:hypothetical protein MSPP1_000389 [Malassezia sp. CBS 17886]|nr:hypothetical protein MSPP1_000389 [Malassezia sp. CBS 17886]
MSREHRSSAGLPREPTLAPATPPLSHLMTLYQRYDSLRNSIALLREQALHTPGIEDWPSIQARYTSVLSHIFSIAAALQSASPHFLTAQLATLNEFLDAEAQDSNLFGDAGAHGAGSFLYSTEAPPASVPHIDDRDPDCRLPRLAVHPCAPIPDAKLNWLGTLLRTVPDVEVSERDDAYARDYATVHPHATASDVDAQIAAHDDRCLHALRSFYHVLHAPDSEGDTYDFKLRLEGGEGGSGEAV